MEDLLTTAISTLNLIKKDMVFEFKTVPNMNLNDANLNDATDQDCGFPFSSLFFLQSSSLFLISFSNPWSEG